MAVVLSKESYTHLIIEINTSFGATRCSYNTHLSNSQQLDRVLSKTQELDNDLHISPLKSTCMHTIHTNVIPCLISYPCVAYMANLTSLHGYIYSFQRKCCVCVCVYDFDTYTVIQETVQLLVVCDDSMTHLMSSF